MANSSTARRAMRSSRHSLLIPHTQTKAAIAVIEAVRCTAHASLRVIHQMGAATHEVSGKNAVFGMTTWALA